MHSPFDPFLAAQGFVALDGGLASELEHDGWDLNDPLWSAKVLLDDPGAVRAVHWAFLRAGADCIVTATYQATFQGFADRGIGEAEAEATLLRAVELAVGARDEFWEREAGRQARRSRRPLRSTERVQPATRRLRPLVAAGVGPYGAYLADGSEYRGDYGISADALEAFHRRRWRALAGSSAELIACETIPSLPETRALARLADHFGKPTWISFSCPDGVRLADGAPLADAVAVADAAPGVFAVGVNCCAPEWVPGLVAALAAGTRKAVVAYPNAGGAWDAKAKRWNAPTRPGSGPTSRSDAPSEPCRGDGCASGWGSACLEWLAAGAHAVGGCCRVGPAAIRRMREAMEGLGPRCAGDAVQQVE